MASACALAISSGSIIFIFANQQSPQALLVCFFTGKVVTVHCIFVVTMHFIFGTLSVKKWFGNDRSRFQTTISNKFSSAYGQSARGGHFKS